MSMNQSTNRANQKKVLVPDTMAQAGFELLQSRADIVSVKYAPTLAPPEFHHLLADANGVVLSLTPYRAAELDASPRIQVVARIGVGFDAVEVPALTKRGIPLMIAGTANSVSVAEQALFFMLRFAKRGPELHQIVHRRAWDERWQEMGYDLAGRTLLVVGFGRIGTRIAARARAMEMRVLVFDPYVPAAEVRAAGCEPGGELDAALPRADFVTIHCPKNKETTGLMDARRLALMKPSAVLINTARGGIVDEAALTAALKEKRLAGAGVDVFSTEPITADNPLLAAPNVILSPHMAGVTGEAVQRMARAAIENVLSVFDGEPTRENVVNKEVLR